jgi:hypothetical protein
LTPTSTSSPAASHTEKLSPQPQEPAEFGFLIVNPEPCRLSTKSIVVLEIGARGGIDEHMNTVELENLVVGLLALDHAQVVLVA